MLVLSRRRDEVIVIDGEIKLKVLEIRGGRVRLGIEAPPWVRIVREDARAGVCTDNRETAMTSKCAAT